MSTTLDEERLLAMEPYERIDNPTVGQQFRLLERDPDPEEGFVRADLRYRADSVSFVDHVHPRQDETFRVLEGELVVTVEGEEWSVRPGETVTLPAGVPHYHGNASGVETRVLWEASPPMATEQLLRMLAELARDGKTDEEGTPNLLAMAVFADAHSEFIYLATPPIPVQKALFALLAPLGRLRGYSAEYSASGRSQPSQGPSV